MSDESTKWDKQWFELLTHCHGAEVEADAGFKSRLLVALKEKTTTHLDTQTEADEADADNWSNLMQTAYVPCHPDVQFKNDLYAKLKTRQSEVAMTEASRKALQPASEEEALRTLLTRSYQPIAPRKEFETRLLDNLKERQRSTTSIRLHSRRRTIFLSAASSLAAAAMVMFVVWVMPNGGQSTPTAPAKFLRLTVPDSAIAATMPAVPVAKVSSDTAFADVVPASFETVPAVFSGYRVSDAFQGPALPEKTYALQNMEVNTGSGWVAMDTVAATELSPGMSFRASDDAMGHLEFSDGSLVTVSPDTLLKATSKGLSVDRGFMLVAVPEYSTERFRLHFPERDIAVEPGTDLAVMVESPDNYAVGGAPAPMVMVVDRQDSPGGLALAKGKNGVGPLLAKQLYRLDNYVTPDIPGRTLCDTECQDLEKMYKTETVYFNNPPASLVGGFAGDRDMGYAATVLTPVGFDKKGDRWVAESYKGEPTVKVQYLSDAYFGFANERRDLARELALGSEVIIDGKDGSFYEIYK